MENRKKVVEILQAVRHSSSDIEKQADRICALFSVSKRFEIDFDGNVLAGIEITNNEPKVFGAMNGWGNGISLDKCKITEKTD